MSHLPYQREPEENGFADIVAADERPTPLLRQLLNGVGGLVLLLVGGVAVMLLVLWRSP